MKLKWVKSPLSAIPFLTPASIVPATDYLVAEAERYDGWLPEAPVAAINTLLNVSKAIVDTPALAQQICDLVNKFSGATAPPVGPTK